MRRQVDGLAGLEGDELAAVLLGRPRETCPVHLQAGARQRHVVRAERPTGRHGQDEVHGLADLQPRRADRRREQRDVGVRRDRVGVAGVVELVVDEHAHVVDHGDRLVDHAVPPAVEGEGEGTGGHGVAGGDGDGTELRRRRRGTGGGVDRHIARIVAEPAQMLRRPVVGVLVREHDGDETVQILEGQRERPRIDDQLVPLGLEAETGVFVFRDAHALSQRFHTRTRKARHDGRARFGRHRATMA